MPLAYRKEIDGLRALAIIPVLFYHAGFSGFSGGFVGVDVFFVISGYLIGGQLLQSISNDAFSFREFYFRRARRILPVLFFVVFLSSIVAWMVLHPVALVEFSKNALATLVFSSNVTLWLKSGYFASAAELNPLLHTWSLSLEEQFYLLAPVCVLTVYRYQRRLLARVILILTAVSFLLCVWGSLNHPSANFYFLPTRVWELLVGVLVALYERRRLKINLSVPVATALSLLGISLIVASVSILSTESIFPGLLSLPSVAGTALVLIFANKGIVKRFLGARILVGIGLISYSLYLWHQPLLAFSRYHLQADLTVRYSLVILLVTFILSLASWRFIEKPFRFSKAFKRASKVKVMMFFAIVIFGFATAALITQGLPKRFDKTVVAIDAAMKDINPLTDDCHFSNGDSVNHPISGCASYMVDGKVDVLIMGDSHSNSISYQLQMLLREKGVSSYAVSKSSCIGLRGFYLRSVNDSMDCHNHNSQLLHYARQVGIEKVVITSAFIGYYTANRLPTNASGDPVGALDVIERIGLPPTAEEDRRSRVLKRIYAEVVKLSGEFDVYLVGPIPQMNSLIPAAMKKALKDERDINELGVSFSQYQQTAGALLDLFASLKSKGVNIVNISDVLCSGGICSNSIDGMPLYRDDHHLTSKLGGGLVAEAVINEMGLE